MKDDFFVVGIGASAGGLKAIRSFLTKLPNDFDDPIVFVQHLSPEYKSHMKDLIKGCTHLNIIEVRKPTEIKKGNFYLMTPNTSLSIEENKLIPQKRNTEPAMNHPINQFFSSLAVTYQERAIGIILSGTGTDGAAGLLSLHEFGGKILVQKPEDADFNGMPIAAMATNTPKDVLPVDTLALKLGQITHYQNNGTTLEQEILNNKVGFDKILSLINLFTNLDFSGYKKPTLIRRISKRIVQLDFKTLDDYIEYFEKTHSEAIWLSEDFLIGVTSFFRDPDVWKLLEDQILPDIIASTTENSLVKISCIGCSTGEEGYSLALALKRLIENGDKKIDFKIFCCDLSTKRIKLASKGIFPKKILQDVPEKYHSYFDMTAEDTVTIKNPVRQHLIFSNYDYLSASPMTNMDMVVCRNMLIYMKPLLQEKMAKMFRFSLKTGGILLLGQSESMLKNNGYFTILDESSSVYRNVQKTVYISESYQDNQARIEKKGKDELESQKNETIKSSYEFLPNLLNDILIDELGLAAIYINTDGTILRATGDFRRFLQLPSSGFSNNLFDLLPFGFVATMKNAIDGALSEQKKSRIDRVNFPNMGEGEIVDIVCTPYSTVDGNRKLLIIFLNTTHKEHHGDVISIKHVVGLEKDAVVVKLKDELKKANLDIATLRNQIDVNKEELQTSNEELMATNEELQSTNEELQSVNEELYAVNSELNQKITALTQANDDIDNLINSTGIEVIVVDKNLHIRKTTPFIHKHFDIRVEDNGRQLDRFNHKFHDAADDIISQCKKTVKTGEQHQKELQNLKGQWYIQRITPFMNSRNEIDGAIISYIDITEIKMLYESNKELERFAYVASHDLQEPLRNIIDFIGLLKTEYEAHWDDNALQYLKFIDEAAHRMGALIKDILAYSRLGVRGEGETVDLNVTIKHVLDDLDKKINEKNAKISITGKMPTITGHTIEFHSLFLNLLSNALKFVDDGKIPEIRVSSTKNDGTYLFSVTDNGIGITPEHKKKVFNLFKRLHNTDKYMGTGIGLAHCKKIVELHGGTIWLESEPGEGTTFYFTLSE